MNHMSYYKSVISGDKFTPCGLAIKLDATCLLESSSLSGGHSRYSLLLVDEAFRIVQEEQGLFRDSSAGREAIQLEEGQDILSHLEELAAYHNGIDEDFPVPAGGIGFLSFEFAKKCDTIHFVQRKDELDLPLGIFLFGHTFLIFDHYTDTITILGLNYPGYEIDLAEEVERVESKILDFDFNYLAEDIQQKEGTLLSDAENESYYRTMVATIKKEIIKGNLLQAVPSRRVRVQTKLSAMDAYRNLRSSNPSPYQFYLDFGEFQLLGASPEVHVKVDYGKVILRPIAGTRRRGKNPQEDGALEKELLADEKERAEHLMLIDLARNDLGRVCTVGSVEVTEYMSIERYSQVMHIVSEVEGTLDPQSRSVDAIRSTFPAGTVSGAPKIQAIQTISQLEPMHRGFYAGLVGYIGVGGNLDTCITIRSALKKGDSFYLQAGGGIVYDSDPERELEETKEKMRAMALAVGVSI